MISGVSITLFCVTSRNNSTQTVIRYTHQCFQSLPYCFLLTRDSSCSHPEAAHHLPVPCQTTQRRKKDGQEARGQQAAVPRAVSFMSFDNSVSSCSHPFHLLMNVNYILAFNHRYHFIETWACASPHPRFSEHLFPRPPLEHECIHGSFPLLWATELHFLCTFKH